MDFDKLRRLAEKNEVSLFDRAGRKRTPPYYYDSLRPALGFYFNTFNTINESYDSYAMGLAGRNVSILKSQLLDEDNTVQAIVSFERFFELFIKDLLKKTDRRLTYAHKGLRNNKALELINKIRNGNFNPGTFDGKYLSATFRESIDRFYGLIDLHKSNHSDPIVKRFKKIIKAYGFLDSDEHKASMYLLSWYRDRILHNGNKLPTLWYLDYMMSQRIIPMVKSLSDIERTSLGDSLFYFQTVTNINVLEKISEVIYDFKELHDLNKTRKMFHYLLYIGHLKELGRANLNMNWFVRRNVQATNEYNYKDPIGRAERFANAERVHPDFKQISKCHCCGENTLVVYKLTIDDIWNPGQTQEIDWVKCYLCDYHLRYNVGDPAHFNLSDQRVFMASDSN
jgi:hypothetical protein